MKAEYVADKLHVFDCIERIARFRNRICRKLKTEYFRRVLAAQDESRIFCRARLSALRVGHHDPVFLELRREAFDEGGCTCDAVDGILESCLDAIYREVSDRAGGMCRRYFHCLREKERGGASDQDRSVLEIPHLALPFD